MIDASVIEELKIRNRIDDVISSYVRLERSGQNLKGLCPFHSEKTPSFMVRPNEGYFHCFGCGAGGDVITFVMKAENLAYRDALEFLAQRAGMALPDDSMPSKGGLSKSETTSMNREAAKYFHACLMDPKTPKGLNYLRKERGLSLPLIKHFGLGYAPEGFDGLRNHLKAKGYTDAQMVQANLISESRKKPGTFYDVFRDRMMIPMMDTSGNVVAFSGRRLDGQKMMKYVNTADTPAFRKGKYIFALNFAKDDCKQRLILCEGQMDVIALHGAGFPQAIATMGTAITAEQARVMSRYTGQVVICYDADEAGQTAAEKAFRLLTEVGLETRILRVEGAKDPDEYIKKFGKEAFGRLLDGSKTQFDYKFGLIEAKYDLSLPDLRIKAAEETVQLIASFPSSVEREIYLTQAAKKLQISPDNLKSDVERLMRQRERKKKNENTDMILRQAQGFSDRVNPQVIGNVAAARAEEAIIGLMLSKDELAQAAAKGAVSESDFVTDFNKKVFTLLRQLVLDGHPADISLLQEQLTPDETGRLIAMREARAGLKNDEEILRSCAARLRESAEKKSAEDEIGYILDKKRKAAGKTQP